MKSLILQVKTWTLLSRSDRVQIRKWMRQHGMFYGTSSIIHIGIVTALFYGTLQFRKEKPEPSATDINTEVEADIAWYEPGTMTLKPTNLSPESVAQVKPPAQSAKSYDDSPIFEDSGGGNQPMITGPLYGGLGGFQSDLFGDGPAGHGDGGVGIGLGASKLAGSGGSDQGFGGPGHGRRDAIQLPLETQLSERCVAAALHWLYRHRNFDGGWSLNGCTQHCSDPACSHPGKGTIESDTIATSLSVLAFLAAGQTPTADGPYKKTVTDGIMWLVKHQAADGGLAAGASDPMYAHGLATLTLCETYGMIRDESLSEPARRAVRWIEISQNGISGGWANRPNEPCDTFITGWQVMALKSAQLAGVPVNKGTLSEANQWFNRVAGGKHGGLISNAPGWSESVCMTAIGMLARQYAVGEPDDLTQSESRQYLLEQLTPDRLPNQPFATFFGSEAQHQVDADELSSWALEVRRSLIVAQATTGCASGSWYPQQAGDKWVSQGGRLVTTCLASLTMSINYRHLPLHRMDEVYLTANRSVSAREQSQFSRGLTRKQFWTQGRWFNRSPHDKFFPGGLPSMTYVSTPTELSSY